MILQAVKDALSTFSEEYLIHGNFYITIDNITALHKYLLSEYNNILTSEGEYNSYSDTILTDLNLSIKYIDKALIKLLEKKKTATPAKM